MTKVLVTFGDSWPEGAELGNGRRYGEIISQDYGFDEFYNYGSGGASNEDMMIQFQKHLEQRHQPTHETTAIFFLTNPARTISWPRFKSTQTSNSELKEIILHLFDNQTVLMRYNAAISALQLWCHNLNISDWYFAGWNRYECWLPGVCTEKIWKQGKETAADWFGASKHNGEHLLDVANNPYIHPNFCHPNQKGHDLIASKLADWIGLTAK